MATENFITLDKLYISYNRSHLGSSSKVHRNMYSRRREPAQQAAAAGRGREPAQLQQLCGASVDSATIVSTVVSTGIAVLRLLEYYISSGGLEQRRAHEVYFLLVADIGSLYRAIQAHDLLLGQDEALASIRLALRRHIIWSAVSVANTTYWPCIQRALICHFCWIRSNTQGWDVDSASQLKKAYDHEFPGHRAPFYNKRNRPTPTPAAQPVKTERAPPPMQNVWDSNTVTMIDSVRRVQQELKVALSQESWLSQQNELCAQCVLALIENNKNADPHSIAVAYDRLLPLGHEWRPVKRLMRNYLILGCISHTGSDSWMGIDALLEEIFGDARYSSRGWDTVLRSQLRKAYDHVLQQP